MEVKIDENIQLSICCVTYNHENYIAETINGFLIQKANFNFEIIIADDASTDNSKKIIRKYQNEHPDRITFIDRSKNLGMMGNYVDTLLRCKGKYIAICEGDDYWVDPYKLQKQVDFLESNTEYVLSYHNVIAQNMRTSQKERNDVENIFFQMNPENIPIGHRYHTSSMMFRNIIQTYPKQIFEVKNTGDSFLQFLISRHGKTKFQRNIYPNIRRRNPESLYSYKGKETKLQWSILLHEKLLEVAVNERERFYLNRNLIKRHCNYIDFLWKGKKRMAAFKYFKKSVLVSLRKKQFMFFMAYLFLKNPLGFIKRRFKNNNSFR